MKTTEICFDSATELAESIRQRQISCAEVMHAFYDRIEAVNPAVNAICTLIERERAIAEATLYDRRLGSGERLGPLTGLPVAVKDLVETRNIRTTLGSPLFSDFLPSQDALIVSRMKAAGAIVIGKTNVPEFGAGSHSFNRLFGVTRNPYDLSRSAGGSSGGAAAALAAGLVPLADGSDLGGSLRNPASFCNVVGLRPSPGRVPAWPSPAPYSPLPVLGPMARSVDDVALLLSVIAGPDPRAPLSIEQPPEQFAQLIQETQTEDALKQTRIAFSRDLGYLAVDPEVIQVLEQTASRMAEAGCTVQEDQPDLAGAEDIFLSLRAAAFAARFGETLEKTPDLLKDSIQWNTRVGLALTVTDVANAEARRVQLYESTLEFFQRYDFLILPAAQLPPFPVEWDWVREINGVAYDNYLQWMQVCSAITLTTLPAISVPAGFTADGLPIGVQIVGRPHAELELLRFARAFESLGHTAAVRPSLDSPIAPLDAFVVAPEFSG